LLELTDVSEVFSVISHQGDHPVTVKNQSQQVKKHELFT
jgi:hypothetical protein